VVEGRGDGTFSFRKQKHRNSYTEDERRETKDKGFGWDSTSKGELQQVGLALGRMQTNGKRTVTEQEGGN